ncbi:MULTISPECIES: cyclase family protein [Sphingomonadaceae]|uniref:Cyclase family protein n=1 Tax=Rhizorhabdus wittichii TaxID=160791 RepID=A0A975D8M8_9SPHN|nr:MULTISPECIES: cyclase family protein [Sphingomonadaceae]QTH24784.1 cyclase family protein [Rhizorhabdus wittichii]QUM74470.1 cyclase family protein [Sphingopyxis granuli]
MGIKAYRYLLGTVVCCAQAMFGTAYAQEGRDSSRFDDLVFYDLSHTVPLFAPLNGDSTTSDINTPINESKPVAASGTKMGVRDKKPDIPMENGVIGWGYIHLDEHYSTHIDSTDHHRTTNKALMTVKNPDERSVDEFSVEELVGPIVYIDISKRVNTELAKNGGIPSPDVKITNFDDDSGNNVSARDIDAVKDQITDGAFIVLNVAWERFYAWPPRSSNNWEHPYNNSLNYPGLTSDAVDRLVEIEQEKGIKIGGFVANNVGVESGQSLRGDKVDRANIKTEGFGMYLHAVGSPRGWKIVENAANLDPLAAHEPGECFLIIGALKLVGASGSPARLIAMCSKLSVK